MGEGDKIVLQHEAGLVCPAAEPTALAEAARRLRDDPALRQRLARQSESSAPLYSRERQARRSLNVLRRALGQQVDLDDQNVRV
jgi:glycosyltransferase involved in cell wall biosynthesis